MNKRITIFAAAILIAAAPVLFSQDLFRGEINSAVYGQYSTEGNFDSPLNPGNMMGLKEYNLINQANLRIQQSGDSAALDFRLDFTAYPIADMLAGTAAMTADPSDLGDQIRAAMAADMVYSGSSYIWSADLTRAAVLWYPIPEVQITVGRQGFLTGYGYGWSPFDLVNPPKDPSDPNAFLKGLDSLSVNLSLTYWFSLLAYGILPSGMADGDEVIAGGEFTLFTALGEFKLAGLYGGLEEGEQDSHPHSGSAALFLDILGAGVYLEGALRSRSRRPQWDSAMGFQEVEGPVYSALAGLEYILSSGTTVVLEYFYNQEGWNEEEREAYMDGLALGPSMEQLSLFNPAYFAEYYILGSLIIPFYSLDSEINLTGLFSPDSGALLLSPRVNMNLDSMGNLSGEMGYDGAFSLYEDVGDEAALFPADQGFSLSLAYAF